MPPFRSWRGARCNLSSKAMRKIWCCKSDIYLTGHASWRGCLQEPYRVCLVRPEGSFVRYPLQKPGFGGEGGCPPRHLVRSILRRSVSQS
jgi:hypothetical protein